MLRRSEKPKGPKGYGGLKEFEGLRGFDGMAGFEEHTSGLKCYLQYDSHILKNNFKYFVVLNEYNV